MTTVELSPLVESVEFNWVRLGEVASIDRKAIAPESIVDGTTYVGLENIVSGGEFLRVGPVKNGELASQKFVFGTDHILYGKLRPYLAKIAMPDFAGICSTDILPVRVGDSLDKRFLAYFLRQDWVVDQVNGLASGANLPRISPKSLESVEVPVFPMPYQRRIAAILDKADHLRTQRREALAHLDVLSESLFLSTFGNPNTTNSTIAHSTLGELAEIIVPTRDKPTQFGGHIPWVTLPDLESTFISKAKYTVSAGSPNVLTNRLIPGRSVLLSCAGTVGKVAITLTAVHANQQFYGIVPNRTKVDETYLAFALKLRGSAFFGQLAGSFTIAFFSKIKAMSIPIAIPPLEMQQTFATRVAAVERLKEQHRAQLAKLDALFASLQHYAFRGEL